MRLALAPAAAWHGFWHHERRALRRTVVFLALAFAAQLPALPPLAHELAILATGLALIRLAALVLLRLAAPAAGLRLPRILEEIALLAAYVVWGLVRLRLTGVDVASLVTTSAVITAVIAFAMQDTLGNVLGGLLLELDRSISVGDWMKLDELSGRVAEIRWRHTAIRTRNGELVIVPNSALMKSRFSVIGDPEREEVRWRRWIWFDVDYDVPAGKVLAAAEQALAGAEIPNVAHEPAPDCALIELALGQCRYALRYWLSDPRRDDATDSAVRVHLLAALERAGISPSLPKQVSHEVLETEARQAARRAREVEARIAKLAAVDLFAPLSREELAALAGRLAHAPYVAGDVITRQGAVAHWLYILAAGEVEVWVDPGEAPRRCVATLAPGSVFGEMGMLTGAPRTATVIARSDAECYRLDKAGFQDILRARPAIAEAISRMLAARQSGLRLAIDETHAQAAQPRPETLLERIRTFFGLDAEASGARRAA